MTPETIANVTYNGQAQKPSLTVTGAKDATLAENTHYTLTLATGEEVETIQESSIDSIIEKGSAVSLTVKTEKINVFSADGRTNLLGGVRNDLEERAL